MKHKKLYNSYNLLGGQLVQTFEPNVELELDANALALEFDATGAGENSEVIGAMKLHIDKAEVVSGDMRALSSKVTLSCDVSCVGYDRGVMPRVVVKRHRESLTAAPFRSFRSRCQTKAIEIWKRLQNRCSSGSKLKTTH